MKPLVVTNSLEVRQKIPTRPYKLSDDTGTAIDWSFYTLPQEHLDGRILPYHRTFTTTLPQLCHLSLLGEGINSLSP